MNIYEIPTIEHVYMWIVMFIMLYGIALTWAEEFIEWKSTASISDDE